MKTVSWEILVLVLVLQKQWYKIGYGGYERDLRLLTFLYFGALKHMSMGKITICSFLHRFIFLWLYFRRCFCLQIALMRCYKIIVTCDVCGIFRKLEIISHIFKQNQLEACLRISEEGPSIQNFNHDIAIESWYNEKYWRLSAGPHNYPKKREASEKQSTSLCTVTHSNLESEEEDIWICSVNINLVYACFIKHNTSREKLFRSKKTL